MMLKKRAIKDIIYARVILTINASTARLLTNNIVDTAEFYVDLGKSSIKPVSLNPTKKYQTPHI